MTSHQLQLLQLLILLINGERKFLCLPFNNGMLFDKTTVLTATEPDASQLHCNNSSVEMQRSGPQTTFSLWQV